MKRNLIPVIVLLFFLLIGCEKASNNNIETTTEQDNIPSQTTYEFTHNDQTFHIIPLYEEVLDYTKFAKENPSENTREYFKRVTEPFQRKLDKLDKNVPYVFYQSYFVPTTTSYVKKLEQDTKELHKNQNKINEIVKEALIKSVNQLPGGDKTIFIMPLNPENEFVIKYMNGTSAITLSENSILFQIDPKFYKEIDLKYSVAHEYNHTIVAESREGSFNTILDGFINEGKADSFARIIYPEWDAPWIESLSDEELQIVLKEFKKNYSSMDPKLYSDFHDGNYAKGIPMWSDYKLGFKIVQSYLKNNPDVPIEEWTKLDAKEILKGSEYNSLIQ